MLKSVPDPRSPRGLRHELVLVLAVSVVAVLAGASNYRQIASHAADMPQPLLKRLGARRDWFKFRYSWPTRSVIRDVLTRIDAGALDLIVGAWLFEQARRDGKGEWIIAVDGKVMRGAWTDENDKVTLLSAVLHHEAVTIAQVRVPDGTNEITQAEVVLDGVKVPEGESVLITLDAAHTQRETAEVIKEKPGSDYLMNVKGNQPGLRKEMAGKVLPLLSQAAHDVAEERARGRIRKWSCWITDAEGIDFPHASQAACIRRDVFDLSGTRISKEYALFITSRPAAMMTAADANRHARGHWGIENKSHYVRDMVWQEDDHQAWAGNGPQALAAIRNLAAGLFRLHGEDRIKEATEWVCRDRSRALLFMAT
jgi:predicted transposase YbfD/YdcC